MSIMPKYLAYLYVIFIIVLLIGNVASAQMRHGIGDPTVACGTTGSGVVPGGNLCSAVPTTDVAPNDLSIHDGNSYIHSTGANKIGGKLIFSGGIGTSGFVIDDWTLCAGDNVTLTINGVIATLTEGVDWTAAVSDTATATSLASAIETLVGVSGSSIVANVFIEPLVCFTYSLALTESDATCTTINSGGDGNITFHGNRVFLNDMRLYLNDDTPGVNDSFIDDGGGFGNIIWMNPEGVARVGFGNATNGVDMRVFLGDSTRSLQLGSACATTHGLGTGDIISCGETELGTTYIDGNSIQLTGTKIYYGGTSTNDVTLGYGIAAWGQYGIGVGDSYGRNLILGDGVDILSDIGLPAQTDFTLSILSNGGDKQFQLSHNDTDSVLTSSSGGLNINADFHEYAGGALIDAGGVGTIGTGGDTNWHNMTGCTADELNGVTHSACDLTMLKGGRYKIEYSISFSGANNETYYSGFAIGADVVPEVGCQAVRKLSAGGDVGNIGGLCEVTVADNDILRILMKSVGGGAAEAVIQAFNLVIHQI